MKAHLFLLAYVALLLSDNQTAVAVPTTNNKATIRFGLTGFKPYSNFDINAGTCDGPALDISHQLLSPFGFDVLSVCSSPARLYRSITDGLVDISLNIKSTSVLQNTVTFTKIPFDDLVLNLYTNKDYTSNDKKIAAIRGYEYEGFRSTLIQRGYEFLDVANNQDALRLFVNNRAKHLLSYDGPFRGDIDNPRFKKNTMHNLAYKKELLLSVPTYFAISKASPQHDALVEAFNTLDSESTVSYYFDLFEEQCKVNADESELKQTGVAALCNR